MKKEICICKNCNREYDKENIKRVYGKESMPYLLGFCSAKCYTERFFQIYTNEPLQPLSNP